MGNPVESFRLLVMIPALNEECTIGNVIGRIPQDIAGVQDVEVLVIDDGSTDQTAPLARKAGAHVISHGGNRGVGAAFHTGVAYALDSGAYILVNMDGDGQFSPEDIPKLVAPVLAGEADMVTASRFMQKEYWPEMSRVKFWGNRFMASLVSRLIGRRYYDVACGFRAYSREAVMQLNLFGQFTYTQETFLDLSFKGLAIQEVPVRIRGTREFGKSRVASNLFRYGIQTSKIIFRSFRDFKPMMLFGWMAFALFALSAVLSLFLLIHYVTTGAFSPHKWAGILSGLCMGISLALFVTGLVADMLGRIRQNQEKILYVMKKNMHLS